MRRDVTPAARRRRAHGAPREVWPPASGHAAPERPSLRGPWRTVGPVRRTRPPRFATPEGRNLRYTGLVVTFVSILLLACNGAEKPQDSDTSGGSESSPGTDTACDTAWYADVDADGYGDADSVSCEPFTGAVADATDCDDTRGDVNPGAVEVCNGRDDDCDGQLDSDATDMVTSYVDADGDDYGDATTGIVDCGVQKGYVTDGTDCDDTDAEIHPGADETDCQGEIDYNCDGSVGSADLDGDGWLACEDCADDDAGRNPEADEVCDTGVDEDCDGLVDGDDTSATGGQTWYRDADGDDYGNDAVTREDCDQPSGFAAEGGDCDDADSWRNPGRTEVCDPDDLDEDCSWTADDLDAFVDSDGWVVYGYDADGDGFGDEDRTVEQCDPPAGYVADDEDCNDANADVNPGADEVCNGYDDDCDTAVDVSDASLLDGIDAWSDRDRDGLGDPDVELYSCEMPMLFVTNSDDCDDGDATLPDADGSCVVAVTTDTGDTGDTADTGGGGTQPVRFVALGDAGDGDEGQYAVAAAMVSVCETNGCDFALYLGDNFYPSGVSSTDDELWTTNFQEPYADLDLQFRATMGNHDWGYGTGTENLDAQVAYTQLSEKWYMPADHYAFVEGDATFVSLDTQLLDIGSGEAQPIWVPARRAASTTTWNIAFGHHPYISNGPHGNATGDLYTFMTDYVCGEYDLYLSGHDHNLQWLGESCGTTFAVSGAGHSTYPLVGSNPTSFEVASMGFLWVEIDGNTLTGVFYDDTGAELYRDTIVK